MAIPNGAGCIDRHETYAMLDQAPRQQAPLPQRRSAILAANRFGLGPNVKGLFYFAGSNHHLGLRVKLLAEFEVPVSVPLTKRKIELFAQPVAIGNVTPVSVYRKNEVLDPEVGGIRIANREGAVFPSQKTGAGAVVIRRTDHIGQHLRARPQLFANERPNCRILQCWRLGISSQQMIESLEMDGASGRHGADDGKLVCLLGRKGQMFTDLDSGDVCGNGFELPPDFSRRIRLRIK